MSCAVQSSRAFQSLFRDDHLHFGETPPWQRGKTVLAARGLSPLNTWRQPPAVATAASINKGDIFIAVARQLAHVQLL
jgi:hypothetical protein